MCCDICFNSDAPMAGRAGRKDGQTDVHCWPHTRMDTHTHIHKSSYAHMWLYCLLLDACLFVCVARFVCVVAPVARIPALAQPRDHFQMPFTLKPMRERFCFFFFFAMATLVINATTLLNNRKTWGRDLSGLLPKVRCACAIPSAADQHSWLPAASTVA